MCFSLVSMAKFHLYFNELVTNIYVRTRAYAGLRNVSLLANVNHNTCLLNSLSQITLKPYTNIVYFRKFSLSDNVNIEGFWKEAWIRIFPVYLEKKDDISSITNINVGLPVL